MYNLQVKPDADKIFKKLSKKNKQLLIAIHKKIDEIRANPNHEYKFLRNPLQNFNRVHIDKRSILIFRIDHNQKVIDIYYFDHRDNVYKWRP